MKIIYVFSLTLIFIPYFSFNFAADNTQPKEKSYHAEISEFVAFLAKKHPTALSPKLTKNKEQKTGRPVKKIILQRANGKQIETCLQALREFDWERGTQSDAPQGSKLAGKHAQFLALSNEALGVAHQEKDEDSNLITTFEKEITVEDIATFYRQVPGIQGMIAELPGGRCIMKHWATQAISDTHSS